MELERILRSQGFGSRPECRALIHSGRVRIEGQLCEDPYADYAPEGLIFSVDEQIWNYRKLAYLLLNKPAVHTPLMRSMSLPVRILSV